MSELIIQVNGFVFFVLLLAAMACARTSVVQLDLGLDLDQFWIRIWTWIKLGFGSDPIVQWIACWIQSYFVLDRPGFRRDPVRVGLLDGAVPKEP